MKRIFITLLTLVILLVALTGCNAPQSGDEQGKTSDTSTLENKKSESSKYLSEVNGVYKITLPKNKKEITLNKDQVNFVPYITDVLVEAAENKITNDLSQYSSHSDFYLEIIDNYLYLTVEVIEYIDTPVSDGEYTYSGCGYDHEHIFFRECISTQN